jgi:hypothetical protein
MNRFNAFIDFIKWITVYSNALNLAENSSKIAPIGHKERQKA